MSLADEITKLAELVDKSKLTAEEFKKAKTKLLREDAFVQLEKLNELKKKQAISEIEYTNFKEHLLKRDPLCEITYSCVTKYKDGTSIPVPQIVKVYKSLIVDNVQELF